MKRLSHAQAEAMRLGLKMYEGNPCGVCGSSFRWTASRNCVECQRIYQAEAQRRRRAKEKLCATRS
jgi:hypothetical protein